MKIDGKFYRAKNVKLKTNKHLEHVRLEEVNVEEFRAKVKEIAEELSKKVQTKKWLESVISELDNEEIKNVEKELKKDNPFIRVQKGCFTLKVGKVKIPIRD